METTRIAVIGSGNVATHIARALDADNDVVQIISRDINHARELSSTLRQAVANDDLSKLLTDIDVCIISVNDDSIAKVAAQMPPIRGIVAHTSGSIPIDVLEVDKGARGVFYPLQTFSKSTPVEMSSVPFFIEADDTDTFLKLEALAKSISDSVYAADSRQRALLHIAAVFGCNFFNHMLEISTELLSREGYSLDVLQPLIEETMHKAFANGALISQTGPAVRNDKSVIEKHLSALSPVRANIYRILSDDIYRTQQTRHTK